MDPHPPHHLGKLEEKGWQKERKSKRKQIKKKYYDKSSVGWRMETNKIENEQKDINGSAYTKVWLEKKP